MSVWWFVVGISGVFGFVYGIWLFVLLCEFDIEMYVVVFCVVVLMMVYEIDFKLFDVVVCVSVLYCSDDIVVLIVSGLFCMFGMIVVLCLMKMFVEIVSGLLVGLIVCVVDVVFKECCWFVLFVCEMLYMFMYLCNMVVVIEMGVIVVLFVLVFYVCFVLFEQMIDYMFGCVFDLFDFDFCIVYCWKDSELWFYLQFN